MAAVLIKIMRQVLCFETPKLYSLKPSARLGTTNVLFCWGNVEDIEAIGPSQYPCKVMEHWLSINPLGFVAESGLKVVWEWDIEILRSGLELSEL